MSVRGLSQDPVGCRGCIMALFSLFSQMFEESLASVKQARILVMLLACLFALQSIGCAVIPERRKDLGVSVALPFMRMEAGECYFVDDFMPTPDSMVTGRSGGMFLRYYTYRSAVYKVWESEKIMLAFYSRDNRCWSLFEEYAATRL